MVENLALGKGTDDSEGKKKWRMIQYNFHNSPLDCSFPKTWRWAMDTKIIQRERKSEEWFNITNQSLFSGGTEGSTSLVFSKSFTVISGPWQIQGTFSLRYSPKTQFSFSFLSYYGQTNPRNIWFEMDDILQRPSYSSPSSHLCFQEAKEDIVFYMMDHLWTNQETNKSFHENRPIMLRGTLSLSHLCLYGYTTYTLFSRVLSRTLYHLSMLEFIHQEYLNIQNNRFLDVSK